MPKGRIVKKGEAATYGYTEDEWLSFHKSKRSRIRHPENFKKSYDKWAASKSSEYHRARLRKSQLKSNYGIDEKQYEDILNSQGRVCAICGTDKPTGRWKVFAVDHCHTTGKVRGLLCNECNRGIGLLKDSIPLLQKAIYYLKQ